MSPVAPLPGPFNYTVCWIWSQEGILGPRPDGEGPFRTRLFRRTFDAPAGARLTVHVSADTQYRLWCNGQEASYGPAKGDVDHQFYETVDLSGLLKPGKNVLAAQVVYYGDVWGGGKTGGPYSRMPACPGLVLWGVLTDAAGKEIEPLHSDEKWRVWIDRSCIHHDSTLEALWLGATEVLHCDRFPWGFQEAAFDDSSWSPALPTAAAVTPAHCFYAVSPHRLVPRMIAPLEVSQPQPFEEVFAGGTDAQRAAFRSMLQGSGDVTLPAGAAATFLLRVPALTTGFPMLRFSGGAGSTIRLRYAESLWQSDGTKANRNDPAGEVRGYCDALHPDGPEHTYQPFCWRTFRVLAVEVEVADRPLKLHSLQYKFTAYPFEDLAKFESSDASHAGIWDICWRTARLCAHETYEDCPYYEQLQYGGDTQVQAMISYCVPGDASLAKQWLYQYDWSRTSDGLTRSRYPSRVPQVIPFWSLHWVMGIRDYWQHTGDRQAVRDLLPGVQAVLDYFDRRVTDQGIVGKMTGWQCADWCPQWTRDIDGNGVPPGTLAGQSAFVSLITAVTLDQAAELAESAGRDGAELRDRSARLKSAVHKLFYDPKRGLYRDTPDGDIASAYTNVWAILADMPCDLPALAEKIISDRTLCQLTMFSGYFAYRALVKAGRYDLAPQLLKPWPAMLEWGLTTCPEIPSLSHTRSDCHAWSAGPLVEFCREILGVQPAEPGYAAIRIAPQPAGLRFARGRVPLTRLHAGLPARFVNVDWRIEGGRFLLQADSPPGVPCHVTLPGAAPRTFAGGGRIRLESAFPGGATR